MSARFAPWWIVKEGCDAERDAAAPGRGWAGPGLAAGLLAAAVILAAVAAAGCGRAGSKRAPVVLNVLSSAEKREWIEKAAERFNKARKKTAAGRVARAELRFAPQEDFGRLAGDAAQRIHAVIPAAGWVLEGAEGSGGAGGGLFAKPGTPVIRTALVFATHRSVAEERGWIERGLGWSDVLALAEKAAAGGSGGAAGPFFVSLPNPDTTVSGVMTLLAFALAARGSASGGSAADLDDAAAGEVFRSLAGAVPGCFPSPEAAAAALYETPPGLFSVVVAYEHQIAARLRTRNHGPLVIIPPREGTWVADHPFALVRRPWVGEAEEEAGRLFLEHLLSAREQAEAEKLGFRPTGREPERKAPFLPPEGPDPAEPVALPVRPSAGLAARVRALWRESRPPVTVVFALDTSPAMAARAPSRLEMARRLVVGIARRLRPVDRAGLLGVGEAPVWLVPVTGREEALPLLEEALRRAAPDGVNALRDSLMFLVNELAASKPLKAPCAVVLLSHGTDEASRTPMEHAVNALRELTMDGSMLRVHGFSLDGLHGFDTLRQFALVTGGRLIEPKPERLEEAAEEAAASF